MYHLCKANLDKERGSIVSFWNWYWNPSQLSISTRNCTPLYSTSSQLSSLAAVFCTNLLIPHYEILKIDKNACRKIENLMSLQNTEKLWHPCQRSKTSNTVWTHSWLLLKIEREKGKTKVWMATQRKSRIKTMYSKSRENFTKGSQWHY